MSDDDVVERDGVRGRVVYVWAIWSPVDDCYAAAIVWKAVDRWKAAAVAGRLSKFWPFPMAVVQVFEPLEDREERAIVAALSALPPPRAELRLSREELERVGDDGCIVCSDEVVH